MGTESERGKVVKRKRRDAGQEEKEKAVEREELHVEVSGREV